MKKYSLLKTIGISFLLVCILSWIISASSLSSGTITSLSKTVPVGLYDLSLLPIITLVSFFMYGLLFLAIGGFYGVLNKTGAYSELVSNVANKVKPKKFVIITIILLSLLSSLTNLTPILFITVPFLVAILLKQGFNKISAFAATVGSILVGTIGTTYGVINAQIKYYFELSSSYELYTKIILLVMVTFLLIMYVIKKGIPKEENKKTKQKAKEIRKHVITLISKNKHWNTNVEMMTNIMPDEIYDMLESAFYTDGAHERRKIDTFSPFGDSLLSFNHDDFFNADGSRKNTTVLAWMLKSGKLTTDVGTNNADMFVAPYVFTNGMNAPVKQQPVVKETK